MIRIFLAFSIFVASAMSNAETLSTSAFRMEVEDGWVHRIESGDAELVNFYHPDGIGTLKLRSLGTPATVGTELLRNMTNVDSSIQLTWQNWGDFSGYQYDYSEANSFFRQWWLALGTEIILVVYESATKPKDSDIGATNKMVNSMTVIKRQADSPDQFEIEEIEGQ